MPERGLAIARRAAALNELRNGPASSFRLRIPLPAVLRCWCSATLCGVSGRSRLWSESRVSHPARVQSTCPVSDEGDPQAADPAAADEVGHGPQEALTTVSHALRGQ